MALKHGIIVKIQGQEFELVDGYGAGANPGMAYALKPVIKAKRPPKTIKHLGHKYILATNEI